MDSQIDSIVPIVREPVSGDCVFCIGDGPEDRDRIVIEDLSVVGQDGLFSQPVEEVDAEFLLELFDLDGDGGLGIAECLGGLGKALFLGNL